MQIGDMLGVLKRVEEELRVGSFLDSVEGWRSLDVVYEQPHVERVWRPMGSYRVNLHRIHVPDSPSKALFHRHPWPSAVRVLAGGYLMQVGARGDDFNYNLATLMLEAGSAYEMIRPDGWHSVAPYTVNWSLMVTGLPWGKPPETVTEKQQPLAEEVKAEILAKFRRDFYPKQ